MSTLSLGSRKVLEVCGSLQDFSSHMSSHGGSSGVYSLGRKTLTAERLGAPVGQKGRGELQPAWGGPEKTNTGPVEKAKAATEKDKSLRWVKKEQRSEGQQLGTCWEGCPMITGQRPR